MKTWIMVFKATLILTIFTAIPHAFAKYASGSSEDESKEVTYLSDTKEEEEVENDTSFEETEANKAPQSPLLGYWFTTYDELEIGVTYEFREEGEKVQGYSIEIYDKDENKMSDNTLAMTEVVFENEKGRAKYFVEYEGEKYEVDCELKLNGKNLEVSYSYYGYSGTEVWERVN